MPSVSVRSHPTFGSNDRGTVAVMFALIVVPLIGAIGISIDYGRTTREHARIQRAADIAVEAGLQELVRGESQVGVRMEAQFRANLPPQYQKLPIHTAVIEGKRAVKLETRTEVQTPLWSVLGKRSMKIEVSVVGRLPKPRDDGDGSRRTFAVPPAAAAADAERTLRATGIDPAKLRHMMREMPSEDMQRAMREIESNPDMQRIIRDMQGPMGQFGNR